MKKKTTGPAPYSAPLSEWICFAHSELLCESPDEGMVEDVDYEDWI